MALKSRTYFRFCGNGRSGLQKLVWNEPITQLPRAGRVDQSTENTEYRILVDMPAAAHCFAKAIDMPPGRK